MNLKKLFLTFISISVTMGLFSQTNGDHPEDRTITFLFVPGNDMFYTPWKGNGESLEKLYSLIDEYRAGIESGQIPLNVDGYCASASNPSVALKLAKTRSNRVKSELIIRKGLKEEYFHTTNHISAYQGNRDVVVVTLRLPVIREDREALPRPEPLPEPQPDPQPEIEPEPVAETEPLPEHKPKPVPTGPAIRTNLLYDGMLTPTLGLEWRINQHVGIKVDGSFAHWGNEHGRVQKMWMVNPEVRWYLLDSKAFYLGLGATIGEANIYGGIAKVLSKDTGYQGNFYGGGITVGYQLPLNRNLLLDFNAGLGYTRFDYDTFIISNGYRVYKGRDLTKNFWGPTQAGISLVWLIK